MAKKAAAKRKSRNTKSKATKPSWLRRLFWLMFKLGLLASVFAGIGLVYLDIQIRDKFEGKRWALPAKVYARPLELYPGQVLSRESLKLELKGLGYKFQARASQPGTVEWASKRARIYSRGFDFVDGLEPSRRLLVDFAGGSVSRIRDDAGRSVNLARLEPIQIGGIYPKSNEDRDLLQIEQAPPYLVEALVAIEDRDYYSHYGVSPKGIARAMWVNLKAGRIVQGGSTLTQQLVKNFYLTSDRSFVRKLLEIPMAFLLDRHYSKDEILEAYLNEVYLGQKGSRSIHGFGLASQYFFAQPIQELKLHQVALLAAMVKGPSYYDPRRNPARAKKRRDLVLKVLENEGAITAKQRHQAAQQPLSVVKQKSLHRGAYPAYLDLVKRQLREEYPDEVLSSDGLRIFTALDPVVQANAEQSLVSSVKKLTKKYGKKVAKLQGSMVVSNPYSGEVLAVVGGKNTRYQGFNRAIDAIRPVGSLIKPAVYLTALEKGYTLASLLEDEPLTVDLPDGSWTPKNYDRKSHGDVPLYYSLAKSYNQSTVRLGMDVGVDEVLDTLRRLGFDRDIPAYPSLFLGATAMSPIEVAQIYQTIAGNGFQLPLRAIRMVADAENQELSRYSLVVQQTVNAGPMYQLQFALQQVAHIGTARSAYASLPQSLNLAGKTGTTNDQRDSWFAGFTGDRLAVVWLGADDNSTLPLTGSSGALKTWVELMKRERPQPLVLDQPSAVEYLWVDELTGLGSAEECGGVQLPFLLENEPQEYIPCAAAYAPGYVADEPLDWFKNWFR
ncbi:penicillin-binding protein 1B [Aliamphritea ceti]|uniref:penicillin-binding protein 1B n=1 Tax=Aliamphritea ceti TaxID=1524258 RepID=UPI0021C31C1F|nr:penicillin-binding protein 1B [Aliamphritea ceti]